MMYIKNERDAAMEINWLVVGMVLSGLFFGWTIGSHYTGVSKPLT